jgi:hypothetical protein
VVCLSLTPEHTHPSSSPLSHLPAQAQPYYCKDINAGSDEDPDLSLPSHPTTTPPQQQQQPAPGSTDSTPSAPSSLPAALQGLHLPEDVATALAAAVGSGPPSGPFNKGHAAVRSAYAKALGQERFMELVHRVGGPAGSANLLLMKS